MKRVLALVEGQTEKKFVKELIGPAFAFKHVFITARLTGKPGHKGGTGDWHRVRNEIISLLKQDNAAYCTMMFDYYGLPGTWPGKSREPALNSAMLAKKIEAAVHKDIMQTMDPSFDGNRFIPYIQMHEFEALLFSDPQIFAETLQRPDLTDNFQSIAGQFDSPEDINDNPDTAPSKRISKLVSGYQKVLHGNIGAARIGLPAIRSRCPHFDEWLTTLENL